MPNLGTNDRDPKVIWDESHEEFIMVIYQDDPAKFIYLTSPNLLQWTRKSDISFDNMNECPDFFPMEVEGEKGVKKWVMMSGHGKFFEGDNWNYLLGSWDGKKFTAETPQLELEKGVGNYSTQTWSDAPNQRRIFLGWFTRSFESFGLPGMPANGQFRIPWEFKLKRFPEGLRLTALPIKEFNTLRAKVNTWKKLIVREGENPTAGIKDSLLDINVKFKIGTATTFGFNVMGQQISYDPIAQKITSFQYKGKPKAVSLKHKNKVLELRIIVDNGALEIFLRMVLLS
ncbi:MAG: GH32 C-terminal domain-containing protein [Segetibacter sp.]